MIIDLERKYYYVINEDLKMSKGKIASQVSHVAMQLGECYDYIGRAVVLKTSEEILKDLKENADFAFSIIDAGLTEVPENSLTCVGFISTTKNDILTKTLKLV